jgi:hypothetical protein
MTPKSATKKAPAKKTTAPAKKAAIAKKTTAPAKKAAIAKKAAAPAKKAAPAKAAAEAAAKRVTPKTSPLAGTSVSDYIAARLSGWQADVASRLVKIVQAAAPEAAAVIKWGQPVFEAHGPFAYMRGSKNHLTFGFWRGAELSDPGGLLEGEGDRMQHVKITGADALDEKVITAWVKQAVALNREKGSPTMRG